MIDLVYKIGTGFSGENYSELRYSIRSAVEHFKDLGNIYIIGYRPSWLENVIHMPLIDCYTSNKDANLINKLILVCQDERLSAKFLNMSYDNFFMRDADGSFFERPIYNNETIKWNSTHKLTKWERRLQRTIDVLKFRKLPYNCYDIHMPMLIDKSNYVNTLFSYDYGFGEGYCGNTLYFNTLKANGKTFEKDMLLRLENKVLSMNELEALNKQKVYTFNYTIGAFNKVLETFLAKRFGTKSRYEI